MTKDPVCGMMVQEQSAAGHVQYLGKDYYFCSESCLQKFEASPQDYVEDETTPLPSQPQTDTDTLYTCLDHRMVLAPRPGTCPKCGKPLVPLKSTPQVPEW
jgi:Cu+-exporting ATPase